MGKPFPLLSPGALLASQLGAVAQNGARVTSDQVLVSCVVVAVLRRGV